MSAIIIGFFAFMIVGYLVVEFLPTVLENRLIKAKIKNFEMLQAFSSHPLMIEDAENTESLVVLKASRMPVARLVGDKIYLAPTAYIWF